MKKEQILNRINCYENKVDINKVIKELDEKLSEFNLSYDNIITILIYSRYEENVIEFSFLTKPDIGLKLKANIIKEI